MLPKAGKTFVLSTGAESVEGDGIVLVKTDLDGSQLLTCSARSQLGALSMYSCCRHPQHQVLPFFDLFDIIDILVQHSEAPISTPAQHLEDLPVSTRSSWPSNTI